MEIVENLLEERLEKGHINLASILLIVMRGVELMSQKQEMTSEDKLKTALTLLPEAIDHSVQKGWITPEQGKSIQNTVAAMGPALQHFIGAICWVAADPEFIQMKEQIKAKCLAFCNRHGRGTA